MATSIIDEGYEFFISNIDNILLTFLFLVIGFIYVVLNNISFKTNKDIHPKTTKVVIYETMENMLDDEKQDNIETDECSKLKGKSHKLEEYCNSLHPKLCKYKECCILGKEKNAETMKCYAGGKLGPTYHTDDDGNNINLDYYYYQGKCFGKGCKKE